MANWKKIMMAAALPCALLLHAAPAASFPDKPLKIVVPYSTGGSSDSIARLVADLLSKELGQPVVVENKPGAGSMLGTAYVAEQAPDGYTMLLADVPFTIVPALYQDRIKYDARTDFAPIAQVGQSPIYLFVHQGFEGRSPNELAEIASRKPQSVTIGSGGNGSFTHLMAELFMQATKTQLVHVPYKGAASSMNDLAGGQIDASFSTMPSAAAIYQAGRVVPIGISSPERHPDTPDVPTFQESGFDDMTIQSWWGLLVPAKTPEPVREQLSAAVVKVMQDTQLQQRLSNLGVDVPEETGPETLKGVLEQDLERWDGLVRSAGISLN